METMVLNIDGKDFELKAGLKFLSTLDHLYRIEANVGKDTSVNIPYNEGIRFAYQSLCYANPLALAKIIQAGTAHLKQKPSSDGIEEFLNNSDIEKLSEEFLNFFRRQGLLKSTIQRLDAAMNKQLQAQLRQQQKEQENK